MRGCLTITLERWSVRPAVLWRIIILRGLIEWCWIFRHFIYWGSHEWISHRCMINWSIKLITTFISAHRLINSVLNLAHHLINIHGSIYCTVLGILTFMFVQVRTLFSRLHRIIRHALLKWVSGLFLVGLRIEVWLNHIVMWNCKLLLWRASINFAFCLNSWILSWRLSGQAPLWDRLHGTFCASIWIPNSLSALCI